MNQLWTIVLIGAGGAVGALSRYGTNLGMRRIFGDAFPLGTLTVNVIGCFCLGLVIHLGEQQLSPQWKMVIGVGFLGALTTFSTFGVETMTQYNGGQTVTAFVNVALNVILGLAAVVLGMYLADSLAGKEA